MAKADVVLKFDASTAKFVQDVLAAREAVDALGKKARENAVHTDHAGQSLEKMGEKAKEVGHHLLSLAGIPLTLGGAFELMVSQAEKAMDRLEKKADTTAEVAERMQNALFAAGRYKDNGIIRARLKGLAKGEYGGREFSDETVQAQYIAVASQAGPKASDAGLIAGTRAALYAMGGKANNQDAAQLGAAVATLKRQFPNASDEELENMALALQEASPGAINDPMAKRFLSRASDANKGQAVNMLRAAYQADESGKPLIAIQNEVERVMSPGARGKLKGDDRRLQSLLDDATSQGRDPYAAVLSHPEYLPMAVQPDAVAISNRMKNLGPMPSLRERSERAPMYETPEDALVRAKQNTDEQAKERQVRNGGLALSEIDIQRRAQEMFRKDHPEGAMRDVNAYIVSQGWTWADIMGVGEYSNRPAGGQSYRHAAEAELMQELNSHMKRAADHLEKQTKQNPSGIDNSEGNK